MGDFRVESRASRGGLAAERTVDRGESILEVSPPECCLDVEEGLEWQAPSRKA